MGDGTSTSTRFIPLTHSIHSLRYFHHAPSTSRSPSATAGGAPTKVSSRPSQISSASHLPHSSVRFNVNQSQPSSPAPPSSSTRLSTLTVLLISERYPSYRRQAQLPPYTAHFGLTSITNTNARPRLPTSRHLLTSNDKAHIFLGVFLTYKESSSSSDTLDTLSRKLSYRTKWRRCFGLS